MQTNPLPFPDTLPKGYAYLLDEPTFDPARHLALEAPAQVWGLEALGYDEDRILAAPSKVGFTAPFRLLTPEGADAMEQVARDLKLHMTRAADVESYSGNRNQAFLAGGVYRSRFLRDLCNSLDVADFLSEIAGAPIGPHSLPSQQVYINYAPPKVEEHVDVWHADSIGFDYVLMASDPAMLKGGEFEVFLGTRAQASEATGLGPDALNLGYNGELPRDRTVSFRFPNKGYAIFQQGNYVIHRARRLDEPGERMTVVPGFVPLDIDVPDVTDVAHVATYGEPGIEAELLRHGAWLAAGKLQDLIGSFDPNADLSAMTARLEAARSDIDRVLAITPDCSE